MKMNLARLCLALLSVVLVAACASPPKIERLQGESLPSVAATATFTIIDARAPRVKDEESIDTSLGVGKRIDEALIAPPPVESFRTLLQEALLTQDYKQGTATISIQEFGVGLAKGQSASVNVFGNPGAQGAAAGAGLYGVVGMAIVQLFEQAKQDSKAHNYIAAVAKLQSGEYRINCDGVGVIDDGDVSQAWRRSVRQVANDCAAKLLEAANSLKPVEPTKPNTEIGSPPAK
jgi:hypothetical protein